MLNGIPRFDVVVVDISDDGEDGVYSDVDIDVDVDSDSRVDVYSGVYSGMYSDVDVAIDGEDDVYSGTYSDTCIVVGGSVEVATKIVIKEVTRLFFTY